MLVLTDTVAHIIFKGADMNLTNNVAIIKRQLILYQSILALFLSIQSSTEGAMMFRYNAKWFIGLHITDSLSCLAITSSM